RRVEEAAAADIVEQQNVMSACDLCQIIETRRLRKSDDLEVARVHAHERCRLRRNCRFKVARASAIRRPHLYELRTRLTHHVGNTKPAPDLDELSTRQHNFAADS